MGPPTTATRGGCLCRGVFPCSSWPCRFPSSVVLAAWCFWVVGCLFVPCVRSVVVLGWWLVFRFWSAVVFSGLFAIDIPSVELLCQSLHPSAPVVWVSPSVFAEGRVCLKLWSWPHAAIGGTGAIFAELESLGLIDILLKIWGRTGVEKDYWLTRVFFGWLINT